MGVIKEHSLTIEGLIVESLFARSSWWLTIAPFVEIIEIVSTGSD